MDGKSPMVIDSGRARSGADLPERHVLAVFANIKEVAGWAIFKSKCLEIFHCQVGQMEDLRLVFDMDNKGYVSKNVFLKFLEVFSPVLPAQHTQTAASWSVTEIHDLLCNQIVDLLTHNRSPAFHAWLSREDAEERLRTCTPGTYLWRFARGCVLSIAVTVDTAQTPTSVRHWRISRPLKESYMFTVNGKTKHPSLKLFVERYRKFSLKVQEGVEVILTEGLPYTPSKRHLSSSTSLDLHQLLMKTVSAPALNGSSSDFGVVPHSGHSPPGTLKPGAHNGHDASGHASMRTSAEIMRDGSGAPANSSPPGTMLRGGVPANTPVKLRTGSDPFIAVDLTTSGYMSRGSPTSSPTGSVLQADPTAYARRLTADSLPNPRPASVALSSVMSLKEIDFLEIQLQLPPIGSGAFGVVSRGQWRGVDVAVKQVLATEIDLEEFRREALTWQRLQHHPNIAHLVGVCTNRYPFCLVSEFYPRGSLYDILVKRKEDAEWPRLVWVAMTAAAGILHLHKEDVVHRDISARNILVQVVDGRWIAKVADFGLSRVKNRIAAEHQTKTAVGAIKWLAPETLLEARYSEKSDAYSFGITMWEIFARAEPYENLTPGAVTMQVVRAENPLRPSVTHTCPEPWRRLMTECWAAPVVVRPSFTNIYQRLYDYAMSIALP